MQLPENKKVLCFGEVLWDMLPTGAKPGGAPMNVAIHLNNLGIDVELVSKVGDDDDGEKLKEYIRSKGIKIEYIQTDKELPTSKVTIKLSENKNATYEICEPVAWDNIEPNSIILKLSEKAGLIIFGTLASRNANSRNTLLQILKASKAIKLIDVNLRPPFDIPEIVEQLLYAADIAKLNDDELCVIARWHSYLSDEKTAIQWLTEKYNLKIVIVTKGEKGAVVFENGIFTEHPGYRVTPVDTVGAGDSFLAGLISKLLSGCTIEESLDFACATGAYVAMHDGATPSFSNKDILSTIKNNKL